MPTGAGHQRVLPDPQGEGTRAGNQVFLLAQPLSPDHLVGSGAGEAAESPGPAHGGLQLAALGRGAGVHPHRAVADGETGLERRSTGVSSAC